MVQQS